MFSMRAIAAFSALSVALIPHIALATCVTQETQLADVSNTNDYINGVAASSSTDAWAVGDTNVNDGLSPSSLLLEHFDGTEWRTVKPAHSGFNAYFTGVSARASNDAWAVGNENAGHWPRPLIEHWDGSTWTAVKRGKDSSGFFDEVSAVSGNPANPNDVWAVGTVYNDDFGYAVESFAEHWNGTDWESNGDPPGVQLFGVSTLSNGEAWAVGSFTCALQCGGAPVIDHWDGTQWVEVNGAFQHRGILYGVSATSSKDVWAIGSWAQTAKSPTKPVIEHFDGQSWKVVPWVNPGIGAQLTSITAASPTDAWVAGSYGAPFSSNARLALLEHWDGKSWTIVPAPSAEVFSAVYAITDISGSTIAVGDSQEDPAFQSFFFKTFGFMAHC